MNAKTKTGLQILEAALLLGLLGDALLRQTPWGLNVLLWVGALVAAMVTLTVRRKRELWTRESTVLHAALIVFAAFVAWRDSAVLQVLDALIILAILAVLSLPALGIKAHATGFLQYFAAAFSSGLNAAIAPFLLVFDDIAWKAIPRRGWTKHLIAVLRGLAIAAPIILIFGVLFTAADAVFEGIVKNTLNIQPEIIFGHALLFGFLTWICAGYLRGALFGSLLSGERNATPPQNLSIVQPTQNAIYNAPENDAQPENNHAQNSANANQGFDWNSLVPEFLRLGAIETAVILGLINVLFLSFVIIQIRYFFGGMDLVQTTENFKLAEYARRGFFELCWVAGLVLPILLTTHFLLRKNDQVAVKLFRVLAAVNIGLLFIIMFSAVNRMLLYTGNLGYGMTELRLYPTAFMLWLALVFVWFGLTVLRNQPNLFAWGALWTALFVVASLHVLNPDDFIVRHNVKLMQQGREFDGYYMKRLSDDAVPVLSENLTAMSFQNQCTVKVEFLRRLMHEQTRDLRSFNWARWQAGQVLTHNQNEFNIVGCMKTARRTADESMYFGEGEAPYFYEHNDF